MFGNACHYLIQNTISRFFKYTKELIRKNTFLPPYKGAKPGLS
jgi:hypothetical protein